MRMRLPSRPVFEVRESSSQGLAIELGFRKKCESVFVDLCA
jgi:hypothetical protein